MTGRGTACLGWARAQHAAPLLALLLLAPAITGAEPVPPKVRAEKYVIDVTFRPEQSFLRAIASVTLRALQPVDAIEFELNPRLEIDEVTDGQNRKLEVIRSGRLGSPMLLVRLAEPCPAGQGVTLTFSYRGTLEFHGALDYISRDGILLRDESRWYPAADLAAFTVNDITVRLPYRWKAIASGDSQDIPDSEGGNVERWKTTQPVSSRAVAAYPWGEAMCGLVVGGRSHGPPIKHEVEYCIPPARNTDGSRPDLVEYDRWLGEVQKLKPGEVHRSTVQVTQQKGAGEIASAAFNLLTDWGDAFGADPQSRLTIVQGFPDQQGAVGYSAPGFLVVSEDVVKWFDNPSFDPGFLPHEISHQWFPIQVTLQSQADGWMAEGLGEYLAWRYLLDKNPELARVMVERAMRDALEPEPPLPLSRGLTLFATENWDVTRATLYDRGLLVFRTLETVIGRSRVDAALREYYKRFSGRSASIADFRKICEEISERDLGWFFDYFISGTQIPEIELRRLPAAAPGDWEGEIVLKNVPPEFTARVEMRLNTTKGIVDHSVATRGTVTAFTVNVPGTVTGFTLDPDLRILRWTDAARRHRQQRALLADLGNLERGHQYSAAIKHCEDALQADPDDLAHNHQQILFQLGRLNLRRGMPDRAKQYFARVLERVSMDGATTDFYRGWARVYRARLATQQGDTKTARAEAEAGLAMKSPALDTVVTWPESALKKSSARDELAKYLR